MQRTNEEAFFRCVPRCFWSAVDDVWSTPRVFSKEKSTVDNRHFEEWKDLDRGHIILHVRPPSQRFEWRTQSWTLQRIPYYGVHALPFEPFQIVHTMSCQTCLNNLGVSKECSFFQYFPSMHSETSVKDYSIKIKFCSNGNLHKSASRKQQIFVCDFCKNAWAHCMTFKFPPSTLPIFAKITETDFQFWAMLCTTDWATLTESATIAWFSIDALTVMN